jgi:hypothetical protein
LLPGAAADAAGKSVYSYSCPGGESSHQASEQNIAQRTLPGCLQILLGGCVFLAAGGNGLGRLLSLGRHL